MIRNTGTLKGPRSTSVLLECWLGSQPGLSPVASRVLPCVVRSCRGRTQRVPPHRHWLKLRAPILNLSVLDIIV